MLNNVRRYAALLLAAGLTVWSFSGGQLPRLLAQAACADPSRSIALSGPAACRTYDQSPASCELAWAVTQSGGQPVSCFYAQNTCAGCGPANQASGACINKCAAAPAPAATGAALLGEAGLLLAIGWLALRSQRAFRFRASRDSSRFGL